MRLWIPALTVIVAACVFAIVSADDSSAEPGYSYDPSSTTLTVTTNVPDYADSSETPWAAYLGQATFLTVAEGVEGIGSHAFAGADRLETVSLPSTLRTVGTEAFAGCTVLTSADLPQSLESIGSGAFSGCHKLGRLTVRSVPSVGTGVFDDAGSLVDGMTVTFLAVTVPSHMFSPSAGHSVRIGSISLAAVSSISAEAFSGAVLPPLTVPVSVTSVGDMAFRGSSVTSVRFDGSPALGTGVFSDCVGLVSAELPFIKTIPASAFDGCALLSSVSLSERVTGIGDAAFRGTALKEAVFPGTLSTVGSEAFASCTSLVHIAFTDRLDSLGDHAFAGCTAMRTVEIQGVSHPGSYILDGCTGLERTYCPEGSIDVPAGRTYRQFAPGEDILIRYDFGDLDGSCVLFRETEMSSSYIDGSEGRKFDGWTDGDGNRVTDVSSLTGNTELTAQWIQAEGADGTLDVVVCALSVICAVTACAVCLRRS